jgi:hypothetical protein
MQVTNRNLLENDGKSIAIYNSFLAFFLYRLFLELLCSIVNLKSMFYLDMTVIT